VPDTTRVGAAGPPRHDVLGVWPPAVISGRGTAARDAHAAHRAANHVRGPRRL